MQIKALLRLTEESFKFMSYLKSLVLCAKKKTVRNFSLTRNKLYFLCESSGKMNV
jgi:hypothetical protein